MGCPANANERAARWDAKNQERGRAEGVGDELLNAGEGLILGGLHRIIKELAISYAKAGWRVFMFPDARGVSRGCSVPQVSEELNAEGNIVG